MKESGRPGALLFALASLVGPERASRRVRRFVAAASTVLVGVALAAVVVGGGARPASAGVPAGGMTAAQVSAMFGAYGDAGGHWTGGDGTVSVLLPDGRVAWLFSDTFLGAVNADGTRPASAPMVSNTLVVQDGTQLTTTLHGGPAQLPEPLVKPASGTELAWVGDAVVESGALKVLYNRFRRYGQGSLDVELTGTSLATFALPGLTLSGVVDLPLGRSVQWGSALLVDGSYTYVYGTSSGLGGAKFGHVARVAAGGLGGAWQFWTGSGWSGTEADAARVISGVGNSFALQKVGSQYVLVTQEANAVFDPQFVAYTATSPTGPFSGPTQLLTAPEQQAGTQKIVYTARLHPDLARSGKLLMSYDVNSLDNADNLADARLYRPRFVELDWPRPQPDPSTVPAAPGGLTATPDAAGAVRLQWTAVGGATGYHVHRRDLTNGQTHFNRQRQRLTTATANVTGLITGHRYEFKVTAANGVGEGPFSATVTATARVQQDASVIVDAGAPDAITGSYIVRFKDSPALRGRGVEAFARELLGQAGGTLGRLFASSIQGFSVTLTEAEAITLAGHPDVFAVEQDQRVTLDAEQRDPPSWGLDRIDQQHWLLDQLYRYPNDAHDVNAYVIDTGILETHDDFAGRAAQVVNTTGTPESGDCNGHGTHVAGTVAGTQHGVAKRVRLFGVKVLDCQGGGTKTSVVDGVEWVIKNARKPAVINMSLSSLKVGNTETALDKAVKKAIGEGIVVVAAAGNQGTDACARRPAYIPEVITVANVQKDGKRRSSSNFGSCVDIFAPGTDIVSTRWPGNANTGPDTGTSMAAPHVAGVAAMILQAHPDYTPADVAQAIASSATPGQVQDLSGSPDRLLFVEQPPTHAPTNLTATPAPDGAIELEWSAVPEARVHYVVSQKDVTAGETDFTRWKQRQDAPNAVAYDLEEGHTYEFRVAAANSMGTGPESNVATATSHMQPPNPPTDLTATANNDGTVTLKWQPPALDVWYEVYQRDVTPGAEEQEFTKLPYPIIECCTMTAGYLLHDHQYEFKVTASNKGGEGQPSEPARATSRHPVPAPPTGLTVTAGDGEVELKWTASPTPGVWYWVYQRNIGDAETEAIRLPLPLTTCCTMKPGYLANGTEYEFTVSAVGPGGESAKSNAVRATPQKALPGKVTGLTATANTDGSVTLKWSEPANGPHYYEVYQRDLTANETTPTKLPLPAECCTVTVGLLAHNHRYEFKVGATNGRAGPLSDPAQAVAKYSPPPAPRNLTGRAAGDGTVDLDWQAPSAGNFYYWAYYRDVTAGQAGFTKASLPTERTGVSIGPLVHGHVYEFKVAAESPSGEGPASATIRVTSIGGLPKPPSGLSAQPGDGTVTLRWTASQSPNVWYLIEYRANGGAWQQNEVPLTSCCTFTVSLLTNGTTYEFRLRATNASGNSPASNVVSARPMPPAPRPPTGLTAQAGNGAVTLRWAASPTPNVWYWLEYQANGGAWKRNNVPITTCCTFTVSLLLNGTTYGFRLRATNLSGDSAPSNVATARPMPPIPAPPTGLTAAPGDGAVTLRWSGSPTPSVWYWLEYRANGGAWKRNSLPITTCCTFTVSMLVNGTYYDFRLRATNLAGDSAPSNVASARPLPGTPAPPSRLHARGLYQAAELTWAPSPSPNVMYYVYYRDVTRNRPWIKNGPWPSNVAHLRPLVAQTLYEFRVTAANAFFESGPSNTVRASTFVGGCTANALTAMIHETGQYREVWATNNTRCDGPVFDVVVTTYLQVKDRDTSPWSRWESLTGRWGTVQTHRAGDVVLQFRHIMGGNDFCAGFLTEAETYWTYGDGSRVSSRTFAPKVLVACI
jgi:Subtilase family/Fibronectin type III domain/Peptidase inhibitor I9